MSNHCQQIKRNLVFLVNTTWDSKHWPALYWRELTVKAIHAGYTVHFTSGSFSEWQRIQKITQGLSRVICYPRQSILAVKALLEQALAVVTVDTGFGHLAAALNIPVIALFGATDPHKSRPYSPKTQVIQVDLAAYPCSPCLNQHCTHPNRHQALTPPCYQSCTPQRVWEALTASISSSLPMESAQS